MINYTDIDDIAIQSDGRSTSYRDLLQKIEVYHKLQADIDCERVAIISQNRSELIYAIYSIWRSDSTVVPIDSLAMADDITHIIDDCKPGVIFYSNEQKEELLKAVEQSNFKPKLINLDSIKEDKSIVADTSFNWSSLEQTNRCGVILYTSGTTGKPKGVMLSFKNITSNIAGVADDAKIYRARLSTMLLLPFHHVFPLIGTIVAPIYTGGRIVISPSLQSKDMLEAMQKEKVNIIIGVPRFYELLYNGIKAKLFASIAGKVAFFIAKKVNNRAFSKKIFKKVHDTFGGELTTLVTGGAAINPECATFWSVLGFDILEGYGMTETAPIITFTRPNDFKPGSAGRALSTCRIKIIDGEICAQGDNLMLGYYNNKEATDQTITDGWLHTGDLGYLDKDGYLFVTGRKKELIVLPNGKNITPTEIETKISSLSSAIKEVAIIENNNLLHAIIVPNYSFLSSNGVANIENYIKQEVISKYNNLTAIYKRVGNFSITNIDLPKTRLGKLKRHLLSKIVQNDTPQEERENYSSPEFNSIQKFIVSEIAVDKEISPYDNMEYDLGIDSLAKLSMIDFIENKFGVKIDEIQLNSFSTLKDLSEYIKSNKLFHKKEITKTGITSYNTDDITIPKSSILIQIVRVILKIHLFIWFRFSKSGTENIKDGAAIIAPNHQSFLDTMMILASLSYTQLKHTFFYAKSKHINNMFLRALAKHNNVVVMDITKDLNRSIQQLSKVLESGNKIVIFPEGTRTKDGNLNKFKPLFAMLSKELSVPVVPTTINGTFSALPPHKKFAKPFSKLSIDYHNEIDSSSISEEELIEITVKMIKEKLPTN